MTSTFDSENKRVVRTVDEKDGDQNDEVVKMEEDTEEKEKSRSPLMQAFEWEFLLSRSNEVVPPAEKAEIKSKLLQQIQKDEMAPFYQRVAQKFGWPVDAALLSSLQKKNEEELKKLNDKIEELKQNAGDIEVRDATLAKAAYLAKIGDKDASFSTYDETLKKTVGAGSRIDVVFDMIRLALFHGDVPRVKKLIGQAKQFVDEGGDWERRNLLKIYEAVFLILTREIKGAANLLLDSIATFTCYEMMSYNTFIFYTVLTSVISVDRVTLKNKVVRSPEILTAYREIPNLESFLQSLYKCRYRDFFVSLSAITSAIERDPFFSAHLSYVVREIRVVAYRQFLQSYRSVKLENMADNFGVSVPFLDAELSRFISSGRLNCKIDKVNGVVETNRPDAKNSQYQGVLKQGDVLLNRIQKLTKIISG